MKRIVVFIMLPFILLGCKKDDGKDQCQEDQAKCNGYTYDCEMKACLCEHPYEGAFCDEYYYESFKGYYIGELTEVRQMEWGANYVYIEQTGYNLYIIEPEQDSAFGYTVTWLSESNFDLLDGDVVVGDGSVNSDGDINAVWESSDTLEGGDMYESKFWFEGNRFYYD